MSRILLFLALILWSAAPLRAQDIGALARYQGGGFDEAFWGGETRLNLELSQGVPWRVFTLSDPARLVLDFKEVDWSGANALTMDDSEAVLSMRMGPFRPGWSRLVAELAGPMKVDTASLEIEPHTSTALLHLILVKTDQTEFEALSGMPFDPNWQITKTVVQRAAPKEPGGPKTILLDPGHGGIDPGAQRGGLDEADIVLQFAHELQEVLRRTGDYNVAMTRSEDIFVSLEARVAMAHEIGADLFVSLHADALEQGVAHGATVYTLAAEASDAASAALAERHNRSDLLSGVDLSGSDDRVAQVLLDLARLDNTPRSKSLATHLVGGIKNALGHMHKKPQREASFSVLKSADIPSVLIELGFLSTPQDRKNLQDPVWRAGMAAGIRDGIEAWAREDEALSRLRRQ
ncbi:N-acetylmuramoyl-L-alanine amidase AmiC precursor [Pelagimonas phthalicica]|uniref:N-acetylmuramoyl-L-alanine amidase n=1 Tax=Pelagimonas phthalicica TaxID=1037362 RepID=A0A238JDP6_9RHOB|nr:N-acetylmuramoyl-L-alanine amidase [Pelagimonas phthalicica]TDS91229.1 N-acetylmuramoyl-L-alanine amidase [Pelagimonas phthalicica]SMX28277.1 N-acetylmuramoyl-L-alanine amidase AmiC precursor [Pelagimonas phthalicica]